MFIELKKIIEKSIHTSTEVSIVARSNDDLQIQVDNGWDSFFFDLDRKDTIKLRNALNEFLGES